jgi:IS4 transposase
LFFKWIKQTLRIKHFLGRSENAVCIQVAVALIAYLLLQMAQKTQTAIKSPLAFARLVRVNLMHKKRIDRFLEPECSAKSDPNQTALSWN